MYVSATCGMQDDVVFEVNAVGWAPSGARTALSLHREGDPARLPAAAAVGHAHEPTGRYVLAAGRAGEGDGLIQAIAPGALKPRVTYRVAGWISVAGEAAAAAEGGGQQRAAAGEHVRVSIRVGVDGGAVCAEPGRWAEVKGTFRLSESPRGAAVHVHGAPAGVDVKVMDLRIIATDRKARFSHLKEKADKVSNLQVEITTSRPALTTYTVSLSIYVLNFFLSTNFSSAGRPSVCIHDTISQGKLRTSGSKTVHGRV